MECPIEDLIDKLSHSCGMSQQVLISRPVISYVQKERSEREDTETYPFSFDSWMNVDKTSNLLHYVSRICYGP